MANGSLKKKLNKNNKSEFTLSSSDFQYVKQMEDLKSAVIGMVEMYINQAEVKFLQVKAAESGVDMSDKSYKFDLDLEGNSGLVTLEEVKE